MNFELLRVAIALIGTAVLARQDYKTSFVDEKIIYAMMAAGVVLNVLSLDWQLMGFAFGGAAVISALGYLAYRNGQFGLGDVLLLAALQLLLPFAPLEVIKNINATPLLNYYNYITAAQVIPFILSTLLTAAILALIGSSVMYVYKLLENKSKWKPDKFSGITISAASIAFILFINSTLQLSALQTSAFLLLAGATVFSTSMKKQIMREVIVKWITIKEIEDEDVLATEEIDKRIVERYSLERVLTIENRKKLVAIQRAGKMNKFPVYKNLPRFVPYLFIGLVICILVISPLAFILFA